jgi:hypothetical protein
VSAAAGDNARYYTLRRAAAGCSRMRDDWGQDRAWHPCRQAEEPKAIGHCPSIGSTNPALHLRCTGLGGRGGKHLRQGPPRRGSAAGTRDPLAVDSVRGSEKEKHCPKKAHARSKEPRDRDLLSKEHKPSTVVVIIPRIMNRGPAVTGAFDSMR